jgi:ABC-type uncharacterized transport system ATPase subunit
MTKYCPSFAVVNLVGTYDIKTTTVEKLAEAMVGRKLVEVKNKYKEIKGETVLKVEGVNVAKRHGSTGLSNFDLKIRRGEIVAIAGVEGNGQQEIAQVITGMMHPDSGKVLMHDHDITKEINCGTLQKMKNQSHSRRPSQTRAGSWQHRHWKYGVARYFVSKI